MGYGQIAGYGCRAGTGGMLAFNHAQICPSGSIYNPRWMDMYIRRPIGLERYLCHSRAIWGDVYIWASMRLSGPHPGPMDMYVHQCKGLGPNAHLCALEPGSPPYRFISGLSL